MSYRFPSPCGEWVRKVDDIENHLENTGCEYGFPSPCGEWVRKDNRQDDSEGNAYCFRPLAGNGLGKVSLDSQLAAIAEAKFPSPCGEWVRKAAPLPSPPGAVHQRFRPLAGNGLGKIGKHGIINPSG